MMYYDWRFKALAPLHPLELTELSLFDVQNFVNNYAEENSYSSVHGCYVLLKQALDKAVTARLIQINPCTGVELPKHEKKDIDCLSVAEIQQLLSAKIIGYYYPLFCFLLYTGMRVGEALALTYDKIDFRSKIIHVDNSYYRGELSTPKTANGIRDIPLSAEVEKIICTSSPFGLVFKNTLGKMIDYRVLLTAWHRQQATCGFGRMHGLHALRHTFASNLVHNGADPKTVSLLLGHGDVQTTLNFYCHADITQKRETISLLRYN